MAAILVGSLLTGCRAPATPSPVEDVVKVSVVGTPPTVDSASQFTAIATRLDGSTTNITSQATWRSSNSSVATVNATGLVTAVSTGSVDIVSTFARTSGTLSFVVSAPVTFRLTGIVVEGDPRGPGVPGVTVVARDVFDRTVAATTDSTGAYVLILTSGTWSLNISAPGFASSTGSVAMASDRALNFVLTRTGACPLLGFDGLTAGPFTGYSACGFTVTTVTSNWVVVTTYGKPSPFVQFTSAGTLNNGELTVTRGGATFGFESVDIYSSLSTIPYAMTGIANSAVVFSLQATQPNTLGSFATIANPDPSKRIDTLVIRLVNGAPNTPNPTGLDNIRLLN